MDLGHDNCAEEPGVMLRAQELQKFSSRGCGVMRRALMEDH